MTGTTADLAWDPPAGTITNYRVFRNGALRGSPLTPAWADTGLVSGQTYNYTVHRGECRRGIGTVDIALRDDHPTWSHLRCPPTCWRRR